MGVSWQIAMSETSGGIRPCGSAEGGMAGCWNNPRGHDPRSGWLVMRWKRLERAADSVNGLSAPDRPAISRSDRGRGGGGVARDLIS